MKSFAIVALAMFVNLNAHADGIPMAPTSPYWYTCQAEGFKQADVSISESGVELSVMAGGTILTDVSPDIANALRSGKLFDLNGKSHTHRPGPKNNPYYVRSVAFQSTSNKTFDLQLVETKNPIFKITLKNCVASKNPFQ